MLRFDSPSRRKRGFALLVTITLLALLVLLLVSLATFTRVETQVAANNQKLGGARQNALFALNLALGQLQRHAGPDQRVSAPSNAGTSTNNPNRSEETPHWTGIWRDTASGGATTAPELLAWLVSGNETDPLLWTPQSAVADPETTSDTVWLVGDGTVLDESGSSVSRRVKLPKRPISVDGLVPGLTGNQTVGHYAWWVGDEGSKARINLADPHAVASEPARRGFSFVASQRAAIELIDRHGESGRLDALYPDSSASAFASIGNVSSVGQLPFLSSVATATDAIAVKNATRARFHDITAHSYSVLADVVRGGLKKDLSSGLAANAPSPVNADTLFEVQGGAANAYGVPTWEMLRSFATAQVSPEGTAALQPLLNSALGTGRAVVGPVMTYTSLGLNYGKAADGVSVNLHLSPCVVLWNPYTVALPAADYTVGFGDRSNALHLTLHRYGWWRDTVAGGDPAWRRELDVTGQRIRFMLPWGNFGASGTNSWFRFKISSPAIQPGESLVFMLPEDTPLHSPYVYTASEQTALVPAITPWVSVVLPAAGPLPETHANWQRDPAAPILYTLDARTDSGAALTGSMDVVLTELDTRATAPATSTNWLPPSASPRWYHAMQNTPRSGDMVGGNPVRPSNAEITAISNNLGLIPETSSVYEKYSLSTAQQLVDEAPLPAVAYWLDNYLNIPGMPAGRPVQWIAHGNPRAAVNARVRPDGDASGQTNPHVTLGKHRSYGSASRFPSFNYAPDSPRASSGTWLHNNGAPADLTLFELPTPELGLLSLGQLQHANLGVLPGHPAYAIGNSLADFRIPRDQSQTDDGQTTSASSGVTHLVRRYYDLSWHLNRTLWDRYFLSTVPSGQAPTATAAFPAWTQADIDAGRPLPNSRLHYHGRPDIADLRHAADGSNLSRAYHRAATGLLVAGGFNINSTSEQAWRAVLAGSMGIDYRPDSPASESGPALRAAFSRFAFPTADHATSGVADMWQGYRQLDEEQIETLARNIVTEIKARGPFLSLSDFINRRLADDATGLKGTLQAAIDATTEAADGAANPRDMAPFDTDIAPLALGAIQSYHSSHNRNDDVSSESPTAAHLSRHAFGPKFLTQADVLSALGPVLAARSDTFVVRTYGETVNPVLGSADPGYIEGRAWLEAVVQRLPEYVDAADPAETGFADLTSTSNREFGRQFRVVSFRWLGPADL